MVELVWLVVPYDEGSCMVDAVLGLVGFVWLHLMAFVAHLQCLVEGLHLQLGSCKR